MGVQGRDIMTWDKDKARWQKMFKGKWYKVSCAQLGTPATKEGSYRAANKWWRQKRAELESQKPVHPFADILAELERREDWAKAHNQTEEAAEWSDKKGKVQGLSEADLVDIDPRSYLISDATNNRAEVARFLDHNDPVVLESLYGEDWEERYGESAAIPEDRTIKGLSARFLELSEARVLTGELSASEYDLATRCTGHFADWIGATNEPTIITAERWEAYWKFLLKLVAEKKRSRDYVKKDWRYARMFIEWLASMDKCQIPANLHHRRYRFGDADKAIPTFTIDECKQLVEKATGQLKLHLLLMLNCGMYQGDISELRHSEVDWEHGIITRQRSKVRKRHKTARMVSYKLWPLTFDLLKQYRSNDPERVLLTQNGKQWVEEVREGAKKKYRRDGIQSNFRHLQEALGIDKPLKVFRKTSATLLDEHPLYGRHAQFFLAQKPRSIAEKHYQEPSRKRFERVVQWLGWKYGFAEKPTKV